MKLPNIAAERIAAATEGDMAAMDAVLTAIQPGIYNLAMRMLGHPEDASDATQEILLKVVTHLSGFRGEARFSTWVWSIARHHLLDASTRARERPEVSLQSIDARLEQGLRFGESLAGQPPGERALLPEERLQARQLAVACTQGMLMTMPREQRLAYLLDVVFNLTSEQAAEVLGIAPATYRKRLSRARLQLHGFMQGACGLVSEQAACRCHRQLPAWRAASAADSAAGPLAQATRLSSVRASDHLDRLMALSNAAAVFRAHPQYKAPGVMIATIRAVLQAQGYGREVATH